MATTEQARHELERAEAARLNFGELVSAGRGHSALMSIVDYWRAEAATEAAETKRGWKSRASHLTDAATLLAGFAGGVQDGERDGMVVAVEPERIGIPGESVAHFTVTPDAIVQNVELEAHPVSAKPAGATLTLLEYGVSPTFAVDTLAGVSNVSELSATGGIKLLTPPARPVRLTWPEFRMVSDALRADRDHRISYSTIHTLGECGVRWALDHARRGAPSWATVGGTAFHKAVQLKALGQPARWDLIFEWAEREAINDSQTDSREWYVANKGLENREWWMVEGAEMLKRYDAYWALEGSAAPFAVVPAEGGAAPAVELDLTLPTSSGPIQVIVDQVRRRANGAGNDYLISDPKTGASTPEDTLQLGLAAWAWKALCDQHEWPVGTISGGFWMARKGFHDLEQGDLLRAHPWDEIEYLAAAAFAQIEAGAFLPSVRRKGWGGCGACSHNAVCPALSS